MKDTERASTIWWRPEAHAARRQWALALEREGIDGARCIATFAATASRLGLDEGRFAALTGLPARWLVRPRSMEHRTTAPRIDRRRGEAVTPEAYLEDDEGT